MPIKLNNKLLLICLLLCSLLFTGNFGLFTSPGYFDAITFDTVALDPFSFSGESSHSINDKMNSGYFGYLFSTNTLISFSSLSMKQLRWLGAKSGWGLIAAFIAALMACLLYYSRLSAETYTILCSSILVIFLHKKTG